jgi:hypothetical protein
MSTSQAGIEKAVRKYLDASTGNLPHDEFIEMENHTIVRQHPYGSWVWVRPADDMGNLPDEFPNLAAIMAVAREHDCSWINFDQDADPLDGMPLFDW